MKIVYLFIYIYLFLTINVFAQKFSYQLYIKTACMDSIKKVFLYEMSKDTSYINMNFFIADSITGICILPDTGVYYLNTYYDDRNKTIHFHNHKVIITNHIEKNDTIHGQAIENVMYMTDPPWSQYFCCNQLCEGTSIDYYENGKKRIEGTFKKGQLRGTLKECNEKGFLQRVSFRKGRFNIASDYDEKKVLKKKITYKYSRNFFSGRGFSITEEYKNGKRIRYEKYKNNRLFTLKIYHENGNLKISQNKKRKLVFYENGQLHQKYVKHQIHFWENYFDNQECQRLFFWKKNKTYHTWRDYRFRYIEKDEQGNLSIKGKYEIWSKEQDYFLEDSPYIDHYNYWFVYDSLGNRKKEH